MGATQQPPTTINRVALVTGAAQGIGRATALRLAADGLDVAVADLPVKADALTKVAEEIRGLGCKALALIADVSKEDQVKAMVEATVSGLGRLDVMVANAGVAKAAAIGVMDAEMEDWEETWDVNIRGTILCYKYAARQMVKQNIRGRIIGASSICGLRGYAGMGGYCISKAAVRSLTQSMALELRQHGITVNAYAPGVIETNMTAMDVDKQHGPGFGVKSLLKVTEFRTGKPEDVANIVSFLASSDAHFVTGQTISVDDGVHFA
ncbi:hypothetical protein R3P38DRAFT_3319065 [Favolaschia claudopus]|uniref:NAD(P)-binding protein n=1 Tax=Favolaschia claudopus TaxID=2862362 RepID=A0AAW0B2L9_9AGAR